MKKHAIVFILLIIPTLVFSREKITEKATHTFPMSDNARISVEGNEGNIDVERWDRSEVQLSWTKIAYGRSKEEAEKHLKETEVDYFHASNTLRVKIIKPRRERHFSFWDLFDPDTWSSFNTNVIVHFRLRVPENVRLELYADEGNISVRNCSGKLTAYTDEGDILCENLTLENIRLDADEGDITCTDLSVSSGTAKIHTDEGDIRLRNFECQRTAFDCDEGDIKCDNFFAKRGTFETDEGEIEITLDDKNFDEHRFYTDEGNVTIYFPKDIECKFDMKTLEGKIWNDFDLEVRKIDGGRQCRGSLGSLPKAQIVVSLSEGNIYLKEK